MDTRDNTVQLQKPDTGEIAKTFTFDGVYDTNSTQQQVYDDSSFGLVENVLEGYNGKPFHSRHNLCLWTDRVWQDSHHDGCSHF